MFRPTLPTLTFLLTCLWLQPSNATATEPWGLERAGLLDKPFGSFVLPATHNSYCAPPHFRSPNRSHKRTLTEQLDDGIRFIEIDLHIVKALKYPDDVAVVHGSWRDARRLGNARPLVVLREVTDWLARNPREIVIVKFQETVPKSAFTRLLKRAGLYPQIYKFTTPPDTVTPRDLIKAGKRLLVYGTDSQDCISGLERHMCFSMYDIYRLSKMDPYIPPNERMFFNIIAYAQSTIPPGMGSARKAAKLNRYAFLKSYCLDGWRRTGKRPFSITVDFHTKGALFRVTNELNEAYNALQGRVLGKDGKVIPNVGWECIFDDQRERQYTTTYGKFSFPIRRGQNIRIRPIADGLSFEPETVKYQNQRGNDHHVVFQALSATATP